MKKERDLAMRCAFVDPMPDELLSEFVALLDRIEELENALIVERAKQKTGEVFWTHAPKNMKIVYKMEAQRKLQKEGLL
jgi:hypothetical protein